MGTKHVASEFVSGYFRAVNRLQSSFAQNESVLMFAALAWAAVGILGFLALARLSQFLVGPMLRYQLVQMSRGSRLFIVRFGYGALLLGLLLVGYASYLNQKNPQSQLENSQFDFGTADHSNAHSELAEWYRANARFTTNFFAIHTFVQYLLLLVLTPAFVAGVLLEHKERKTFHILFTTDLSSREMVFGLFGSRLLLLGMVFSAGLPAVPLLEMIGSVEPSMVWSCTAALLITIASVGSLSALNSILSKDSLDAILGTYSLIAIYLLLSGLAKLLLLPGIGLADFPSTHTWQSPVTLADAVRWLNTGNLATAAYDMLLPARYSQDIGGLIRHRLFSYAVFNALVAVSCTSLTVLLLRRKALAEPLSGERQGQSGTLRNLILEAWPILWLECHLGSPRARRWTSRLLAGCGIALLFFIPIHLDYFFGRFTPQESDVRLAELLSLWARPVAAFLGTLLLVLAGIRASGAVVRDRATLTNDGLLMLPISNASILGAKWLASMLGGRRTWAVLAILACYGLITGAIHPLGIGFFLASWLTGCMFVTSLGLWMSIECHSARIATVLTLVLFGVAMLAIVFNPQWFTSLGWSELERRAFIPPTAFFDLLFSAEQFKYWFHQAAYLRVTTWLTELLFWAVASFVVFGICLLRYRHKNGRKIGSTTTRFARDGSRMRVQWRPVWNATRTAGRLFASDLRHSIGRATVFFLPAGAMCAVYLILGWRNASSLTQVLRELDKQAPGWRMSAARVIVVGRDQTSDDPQTKDLQRQADLIFTQAQEKAFQLAAAGKTDEALQTCEAILQKVDDLEGGRILRVLTKRQSIQSKIYSSIEAILAGGISKESALTNLINRLIAEDRFLYVAVAVAGARQEFDAHMQFLECGHTPQEFVLKKPKPVGLVPTFVPSPMFDVPSMNASKAFALPAGLPALPDVDEFEFLLGQALPWQHAQGLQAASEAIDIWSLAREQRMADAAESGGRTNFTAFETAGFESTITAWELFATERKSLLAALLIERFRLRHSGWPENPEEVSRECGTPFPLDPCGKGSLQYRKTPTGVLVYSIGFDGVDNGGNLFKGDAFPPGGFDIGVRLLNPDLRKFVRPEVELETPQKPGRLDRFR